MNTLDLARWQFAVTTVYHFLFVPLTIGLAPLVAVLQTLWHRTGDGRWLSSTRFFGSIFLVNFAIGVVTGIVQEFQFGLNWSRYSTFVGDVFGAPLALEALVAFFLESVFLGAWIFGWDRLPRPVHLASIWLAALGTNLSAYFIIAANSFMQHPVGVHVNPRTGRAELDSLATMLTNPTAVVAFAHTVAASLLTAATLVAGVALWWIVRAVRAGDRDLAALHRPALRLALGVLLVAGGGVALTGHEQARLMVEQQPMKMAAAEGLCHTRSGAGFSLLAVPGRDGECARTVLSVPGLTSLLATGSTTGTVRGTEELAARAAAEYGPTGTDGTDGTDGTGYVPLVPVTYWSFRLMIGLGAGSALLALAGLVATRGDRFPTSPRLARLALAVVPAPFLANLAGWVFTEVGRQPWIVNPNPTGDPTVRMTTASATSPFVDPAALAGSLVVFTGLYAVLAVVWFTLVRRAVIAGAPDPARTSSGEGASGAPSPDEAPLTFAY